MPSFADLDHLPLSAFRSLERVERADFPLKEQPPQAALTAKAEHFISGLSKHGNAVRAKRNLGETFNERNWMRHANLPLVPSSGFAPFPAAFKHINQLTTNCGVA